MSGQDKEGDVPQLTAETPKKLRKISLLSSEILAHTLTSQNLLPKFPLTVAPSSLLLVEA